MASTTPGHFARAPTPLVDERFLLLETLGRGGMGSVYRAFDRAEQRLVALKVASDPAPPGPAHPLAAEFEAWSRLEHPNIVRAYELGLSGSGPLRAGTPYLVLEHVSGGPAHQMLQAGRVEAPLAESVACQVLAALEHVHASGYLHRDLKPGNVLVDSGRRRLKLTDFGLAVPLGQSREVGVISGSLPYVSPEALLGLPLDERSDLYGLGILLFHLVTGELPVPNGGAREILRWHLSGPPADPAQIRPQLSVRLVRFIKRLTARDRSERPTSAREALRLLGVDRPRCRPQGGIPAVGRAERAALRLALDAVRLGSVRVFQLPRAAGARAALLSEVSVWAQVRGMRFHRLGGAAQEARRSLARLVVSGLVERGAEAEACARRFGLERFLPLRFVGGIAVLDRPKECGSPPPAEAASGIAEFLLVSSRARPAVLSLERPGRDEPLLGEVTRCLIRAAQRATGLDPTRGGLLLLLG